MSKKLTDLFTAIGAVTVAAAAGFLAYAYYKKQRGEEPFAAPQPVVTAPAPEAEAPVVVESEAPAESGAAADAAAPESEAAAEAGAQA